MDDVVVVSLLKYTVPYRLEGPNRFIVDAVKRIGEDSLIVKLAGGGKWRFVGSVTRPIDEDELITQFGKRPDVHYVTDEQYAALVQRVQCDVCMADGAGSCHGQWCTSAAEPQEADTKTD